uniref:Hedgehog/Intein (Hint) domain-containing protein n=1 Tax=viral metagenome TaxID=1070528 RepID=A0A6C0AHG8_9ZZZZ
MSILNPTNNVYLKQINDILYYSFDLTNPDENITGWSIITIPISIGNGNSSPTENITVLFLTDFNYEIGVTVFKVTSDYITFDGNNFVIRYLGTGVVPGVIMNIAYSNMLIRNFNVFNAINSESAVNGNEGFLCGSHFGKNTTGPITIHNCVNYGNYLENDNSGGIVGENAFELSSGTITISNCVNNGTNKLNKMFGGIVGSNAFLNATGTIIISNCVNNGPLYYNCGGICSTIASNTATIIIENCVNTGPFNSNYCGGIVFNSSSAITIKNCYSSGTVVSLVYDTIPQTTIDNCYIIDGIFNAVINPTASYNAEGTWVTSTAITKLTIDDTWAYDQLNGITYIDLPFVLSSLHEDYILVKDGVLIYDSSDTIVSGLISSAYNVSIPSTHNAQMVVGIANNAFFGKPQQLFGTIEFPSTLLTIGDSAFRECGLTGTLNLPASITSIGASAFQDSGFIGPLILPASITSIGASAFQDSGFIGPLILPDSITSIGASAFRGCALRGTLILPPNLTVLEDYVFAECDFTSMAPPTQLTHIGARAFYNLPLFVYDFTQCEQLSYIDPSAFDTINQSFLDINVYVTRFTYDRLQIPKFPDYVKFHTGVPVSNICFVAGTRVQTDQGILAIETLTRKHTLNGQPITLTKTKHDDPYLVKIQAYAFTNAPTQDTYMSMNHRIYFNHDRVKARDLVNGDTVTLVDYYGEPLYNVLVKAHTSMLVHGMRVETLDPTSPIALVYTSRLPPLQRIQIIQKLNTQENYEDTVRYLKRMQ